MHVDLTQICSDLSKPIKKILVKYTIVEIRIIVINRITVSPINKYGIKHAVVSMSIAIVLPVNYGSLLIFSLEITDQ